MARSMIYPYVAHKTFRSSLARHVLRHGAMGILSGATVSFSVQFLVLPMICTFHSLLFSKGYSTVLGGGGGQADAGVCIYPP